MANDAESIIDRLNRHKSIFDLNKRDLGDHLLNIAQGTTERNFNSEESPDGSPWVQLTDGYHEFKEAHWPGNPIGVRTGEMRSEIVAGGERQIELDSASITLGDGPNGDKLDWCLRRPF